MASRWSVAVLLLLAVGSFIPAARAAGPTQDWQPAVPGAEGKRAFDELANLYADPKAVPDYARALADLKSGDETVQAMAGSYLLALLVQSLADEDNGRAEWQATPFWGGSAESAAHDIRERLADAFRKNASGASAVQVAMWLIQVDGDPDNQAAGIQALRRITGLVATVAFQTLLSEPALSGSALVGALEEVGRRRLKELGPLVPPLVNSYRSEVRRAALATAQTLGLGAVPRYEAAKAFTPRLEKQIHDIATMILARIPAEAKWSEVKYIPPPSAGDEPESDGGPQTVSGWIVKQTDKEIFLVDWFAREIAVPRVGANVNESSLAAAARTLRALRERKPGKFTDAPATQLSRKGMLTGQFEPGSISLPEVVIGTVAFERGDRATAAAVLFPRIDEMADDRWLTEIPRDLLGHQYHQAMLDHFSEELDYTKTVDLARHLSQPVFDGYKYQQRAREMVEQIAHRGDDFQTLTLPKRDEWNRLRQDLSRDDQIRFLADRLRLLHCVQPGQPADVSYTDPQYAGPKGRGIKTAEVINPYIELLEMKLDFADILTLAPYVADEDFMPTYSYWRDFHPSRTLHRVGWAAAEIVNSFAKRDLVELKEADERSSYERQALVDKIKTWVEGNRGKSRTDLLFDALATVSEFREFQNVAVELVADRNVNVLPLLKSRLKDYPGSRGEIVKLAYDLDSVDAVPHAREWVRDTQSDVRFWAGLILLRHGDRAKLEGLAEVKVVLQGEDADYLYHYAIEDLLALKNQVATDAATGILKRAEFARSFDRSRVLRQLVLAGRQEAFDYILKQLESRELYGTSASMGDGKLVVRKITFGDCMADAFSSWRTDGWRYDNDAHNDLRAARRQELATWLKVQLARIQKGEVSDIPPPEPIKVVLQRIDAP